MTILQRMKHWPTADQVCQHHAIFLLVMSLLLLPGLSGAGGVDSPRGNFSFTVGDRANVRLTFRQNAILVVAVNETDFLGEVELKSADQYIFTLDHRVVFEITRNTTFPFHTKVGLRGEYVGRSELRAFPVGQGTGKTALGSTSVNVYTPFKEFGTAASIILTIWLVISYVIMAAKVEPRVLLEKIKPPWGIIIGMVCQFILMPPLAFALAKAFGLTGALAIGLILVGTCPGGFFSNIEVLLLDCDIVLSLTMTTLSTFLAVGMMPLNLFLYAQPFVGDDSHLQTPFQSLLIQLCGLVLPLVIGVPFFQRFQTARQFCLKLVKPFTFVLMMLGLVLFVPSQYYIFYGNWKVWTTSAILPVLGAFLGMSIARIANFNYTFSITIAIETGCQNTLLAVSVAKLYYEDPDSDIVAIIPLLIAMVTGFEGLAIAGVYLLGRFAYRNTKPEAGALENAGDDGANHAGLISETNTTLAIISGATGEEDKSEDQSRTFHQGLNAIADHVHDGNNSLNPAAGAPVSDEPVHAQQTEATVDSRDEGPPQSRNGRTVGSPDGARHQHLNRLYDGFVIDRHVWL